LKLSTVNKYTINNFKMSSAFYIFTGWKTSI